MVYLFWTIAVGLGAGTLNWTIAIFATGVLTILTTAFHLVKYGRPLHAEYILVVSGNDTRRKRDVEKAVRNRPANVQLRNHEVEGDIWELTYELRFAREREESVRGVVSELQTVSGVTKVSLLTPQLSLPM